MKMTLSVEYYDVPQTFSLDFEIPCESNLSKEEVSRGLENWGYSEKMKGIAETIHTKYNIEYGSLEVKSSRILDENGVVVMNIVDNDDHKKTGTIIYEDRRVGEVYGKFPVLYVSRNEVYSLSDRWGGESFEGYDGIRVEIEGRIQSDADNNFRHIFAEEIRKA